LGAIGGRPNHALYFIGALEDEESLVYLDPHTTQAYARTLGEGEDTSYHTEAAGVMHLREMDPSLALVRMEMTFN